MTGEAIVSNGWADSIYKLKSIVYVLNIGQGDKNRNASLTVRGDNEVLSLVSPSDVSHAQRERALYTYESKMAFFTRMASSVAGAELLLESGLIVRLSEMKVFSARPEATYQTVSDATPRSLQVYRQILFPALRLCLAVLSCLGTSNVSAVVHVKHFIKVGRIIRRVFSAIGRKIKF